MGIFFERQVADSSLLSVLAQAQAAPAVANDVAEQQARMLVQHVSPVVDSLTIALQSPALQGEDAEEVARKQVSAVTNSLLGGASFNTGRFLVALAIFLVLVAAAVGTDIGGLTTSPGALYGFAGSVFGVVVGFLGGESSK